MRDAILQPSARGWVVIVDNASEFAAIQAMHPSACLYAENKVPVVLLRVFMFGAGGRSVQAAFFFYPSGHRGSVTRLFFEQKLEGAGQSNNWTQHTILSRSWWAPSWKDVTPEQP